MEHTLSKDCSCKPTVEDYRKPAGMKALENCPWNVGEPKGREWLHELFDKPSHKRNGPDIVAGHKAIDGLFNEREELIAQNIALSKEVDDLKSLIAAFQSDAA